MTLDPNLGRSRKVILSPGDSIHREAGMVTAALGLPPPSMDRDGFLVMGGMHINPEVWADGLFAFHVRLAGRLTPAKDPVPLEACTKAGTVAAALDRTVEVRGMEARIVLAAEDTKIVQCVEAESDNFRVQVFPTNSTDWLMLCALSKRVLAA